MADLKASASDYESQIASVKAQAQEYKNLIAQQKCRAAADPERRGSRCESRRGSKENRPRPRQLSLLSLLTAAT